jgi:fumarate reductase flavoprotein subunit
MHLADDGTTWHLHTDLAIVGGGGGALVAALAAAAQVQSVVIHERAKEVGGTLARGPGMIPAAGTRMQRAAGVSDNAEAFANDLLAHVIDPAEPALVLAACRAAGELVEWLVENTAIRFDFVPTIVARNHVAPRLHAHATGTGAELCADLVHAVGKTGHVALRLSSVVEDLWTDGSGAVVGLAARERRGSINVAARRVLLACGGFAANPDLVARYIPGATDLPVVGPPGALGDGLGWATACGAATDRLDACSITPFATTPGGYVVPDTVVRDGAILVNQGGGRFVDETADAQIVVRAVMAQPGRIAYMLLDERIYRTTREADPYFARLIVPRAVRRGASVADLARHFEIDVDTLTATLDVLHSHVGANPDGFGRGPRATSLAPPFYAVRVGAARVRTLGGVRVDAQARVVRADGAPIPNLYALGGVAADVCARPVAAYPVGHDTMTSFALGWLAAHPPETGSPP